jgi:Cu(I)/Ag(I) efflux system membrane fusion protein
MKDKTNYNSTSPKYRGKLIRTGHKMFLCVVLGIIIGGGAVWLSIRKEKPLSLDKPVSVKITIFQCPMHPSVTSDHPGDCPICGMKLKPVEKIEKDVNDLKKTDKPISVKTTIFQCPMHPSVTSDHPGDCSICGMKLEPVEKIEKDENVSEKTGGSKIKFYRSPMNPNQTSPVPRKDEMGMDYIPVYGDEVHETEASSVTGLAEIKINQERQQSIGLRTVSVTRGSISASIRTIGRIQADPKRIRKINVKVEGYVEKIYADFLGKPVTKGQPLFSLYSPNLFSAQNEFLLAIETRDALKKSGTLRTDGDDLVASSRRKLELWDIPVDEITRLQKTGKPTKTLTFISPISGVITAKNIVEGSYLNPGDTPYEITDLGSVWINTDIYESALIEVNLGMIATLTLNAYPNKTFEGRVVFIDPVLDPKTRTIRLYINVANPAAQLKPEMYCEVLLHSKDREGLRIPSDAVIRAGTRNVVFLALGGGRFSPQEVQLGVKSGDLVEVLSGLAEGQEVVVHANFLIDSESQLRASLAAVERK